jgi:hypothetical protein
MLLITSGAYSNPGLVAEFGLLPPSMLPLQNKCLYQHQVELFKNKEKLIFMSLPIDFKISDYDKKILKDLNVDVIQVPLGISLGNSIVYALNFAGHYGEPLRILHGDTLIDTVPDEFDTYLYSQAEDDYKWTYIDEEIEHDENKVYIGYYSFSNQNILIRMIMENEYKFEQGVSAYNKIISLKRIATDNWMDFGLVSSYYRSKTKFTTQRSFNDLKINKYSVTKYSCKITKILAEAYWFCTVPIAMKKYVPSVWNSGTTKDGKGFYEIEYFYLSSLGELYVFGRSSFFTWRNILTACSEYIEEAAKVNILDKDAIIEQMYTLYQKKTMVRLDAALDDLNVDINHNWVLNNKIVPSIIDILVDINSALKPITRNDIGLMHGDFCFSNILYNYISQSIKVIDPRGMDFYENQSIYGDIRYDIAKLAHSILGLYDFIVGNRYFYEEKEPYCISFEIYTSSIVYKIQNYFKKMRFLDKTIYELSVYPIMIHLFLSMLPLHGDCPLRQRALLANALRLYMEFKESE